MSTLASACTTPTAVWVVHADCPRSTRAEAALAIPTYAVSSPGEGFDESRPGRSKQRWHLEDEREVVSVSWRPFCLPETEICGVGEPNCRYHAALDKRAQPARCEPVASVACFSFQPGKDDRTQVRCARDIAGCRRLKNSYVAVDRALESADCFVMRYDPVDAEPCPSLGRAY